MEQKRYFAKNNSTPTKRYHERSITSLLTFPMMDFLLILNPYLMDHISEDKEDVNKVEV